MTFLQSACSDSSTDSKFILVEKEPYIDMKTLQAAIIYPEEAKRLRIEGKVVITVLVSKTGIPQNYVIESTASPLLVAEVVRVVMNATLLPATRNSQPVDCRVSITIIFRL